MDELLSERYCDELDGVLSSYDRIVITGSLQPFCYAQGMTWYLYQQGVRIFDYARFAEPLRERIRENAEALAEVNGVKIEFIRKKDSHKESRVQQVLKERVINQVWYISLEPWKPVLRIVPGMIK